MSITYDSLTPSQKSDFFFLGSRIYGRLLLNKAGDAQTPELCLAAVCCDGMVLEHVNIQTPELCLAAVKQSPLALQFVRKQTPELCLAAVTQNLQCVKFVRADLLTAAIYDSVFQDWIKRGKWGTGVV